MFFLLGTNHQVIPLHKARLARQAALRAALLQNGALGESGVSEAQARCTLLCCELGKRKGAV